MIRTACRSLRKSLGKSLQDVATDICFTRQNVYHFEHGNNRNYEILLWYVAHGLDLMQYVDYNGREVINHDSSADIEDERE